MLISKLYSFMPSSAITLVNEFYFVLSTFQVSGKQIHDDDIEVPAALFWIVNMLTHVSDRVLTRSLWGNNFFVIDYSSMGRGELCCPVDILFYM